MKIPNIQSDYMRDSKSLEYTIEKFSNENSLKAITPKMSEPVNNVRVVYFREKLDSVLIAKIDYEIKRFNGILDGLKYIKFSTLEPQFENLAASFKEIFVCNYGNRDKLIINVLKEEVPFEKVY